MIREWERTLRAENKSKNTIMIYDHCARVMIKWLDALPSQTDDPESLTRPETPDLVTWAHIADWMTVSWHLGRQETRTTNIAVSSNGSTGC